MDALKFKRVEMKYLLTLEQYKYVQEELLKHGMEKDKYFFCTIQSLYYDTPNKLLIRRSLEKPEYKEKLRLRGYGIVENEQKAFLEIKKKYDGIVYQRRVDISEKEAMSFMRNKDEHLSTQIGREIEYFRDYYKNLEPSMLVIYDRFSYGDPNTDLRITFDTNVRYRTRDLSLSKALYGTLILSYDYAIMEIKTAYGIPMWLCHLLSEMKIYKTSYSKYGTAYSLELEKEKR